MYLREQGHLIYNTRAFNLQHTIGGNVRGGGAYLAVASLACCPYFSRSFSRPYITCSSARVTHPVRAHNGKGSGTRAHLTLLLRFRLVPLNLHLQILARVLLDLDQVRLRDNK